MLQPRTSRLVVAFVVLLSVASCSQSDDGTLEWVTGMQPGQCADPVGTRSLEVTRVRQVPCDRQHVMETFARVPFPVSQAANIEDESTSGDEYPGNVALQVFAREACAGRFRVYLGSQPRRSWHFLTFLYPSAASWTAADVRPTRLGPLRRVVGQAPRPDRSVVCVLRTTGPLLKGSVRGRPYPAPTTATTATATTGTP